MNYIKEINSFYDWLETNSVSDSAITLWHALMHINNKAGWKVEFTVASSVLCLKSGLSNSSFKRARNILKQSGRIDWRERKGNQSAIYNLISFAVQYDPQTAPQSEPQSDPQTAPQSEPINKLNLNKTKPSFEKEAKEENIFDQISDEFFPDDKIPDTKKEKSCAKKEKAPPPDLETFLMYAQKIYREDLKLEYQPYDFAVRAKYQSWIEAGWKDGHKKPILNWKSKLQNTIPHLKPIYGKSNSNYSSNASGNFKGNSNGGSQVSGKKSASTILAERARKQFAGDGDSGDQTTET